MGASFEEKSVWVQLIGTVLGLAFYAWVASRMAVADVTAVPAYAAVFAVSVGLMIVLMVAGHVATAICSRSIESDERDRLVAWKAEYRSSWLLACGVLLALTGLLLNVAGVWVAHTLLLALYLSQVLSYLLRIVYYRKGV